VNKLDLISAVADDASLTKAQASEAVDAVFKAIEHALKKEEEVRLVGFGHGWCVSHAEWSRYGGYASEAA
jgi:DNA-binding protein HU-beta